MTYDAGNPCLGVAQTQKCDRPKPVSDTTLIPWFKVDDCCVATSVDVVCNCVVPNVSVVVGNLANDVVSVVSLSVVVVPAVVRSVVTTVVVAGSIVVWSGNVVVSEATVVSATVKQKYHQHFKNNLFG